jgi:hypothetical protein
MYTQKPSAIASRSIRSSIAPSNGSSFAGQNAQTIRLSIPCGVAGQYLNPGQTFLKFSVDMGVSGVKVDGSIYQMFQRLVISHNGVVLETIDAYGFLANMLLDLNVNNSQRARDQNVMLGTLDDSQGIAMAAPGTKTWFNMPILSAFFSMNDKYLPLSSLQGDLNIEFTLDPAGFVWGATPANTNYTVADVELLAEIVELDPAVDSAIRKETLSRDGAFKIPMTSWRNYNTTIAGSQTAASLLVPIKVNSMKNILIGMRNQESVTSATASKWARIGGDTFKSWWSSIGSHQQPAKPVNNIFESYCELQKSMHDLSVGNGDSILSRDTYSGSRFMVGIELESLTHRSDIINSGLNTNGINIYYAPEFTSADTKVKRVDFFAHYDMLLLIDPTGQASVVF